LLDHSKPFFIRYKIPVYDDLPIQIIDDHSKEDGFDESCSFQNTVSGLIDMIRPLSDIPTPDSPIIQIILQIIDALLGLKLDSILD